MSYYLLVSLLAYLLVCHVVDFFAVTLYCISVCQDKRIFMSVPQGGSEHVGKTL
jgi:hypothetical protein